MRERVEVSEAEFGANPNDVDEGWKDEGGAGTGGSFVHPDNLAAAIEGEIEDAQRT